MEPHALTAPISKYGGRDPNPSRIDACYYCSFSAISPLFHYYLKEKTALMKTTNRFPNPEIAQN